jgi:hypothetical protein
MTEPVLPDIPAEGSPEDIAILLKRDALPVGRLDWWLQLFARCNAGMLGTASGDAAVELWGEVYLDALDKASRIGRLPQSETLFRRLLVAVYMLQSFGVSTDGGLRDPERMFNEFQHGIGASRATVIASREELVAGFAQHGKDLLREDPELLEKFLLVTGARRAIDALCALIEYIPPGEARREAEQWCSLKPLLR